MRHADLRAARSNGAASALGPPSRTLAARVWELLDDLHTVPSIVSRVRGDFGLSLVDSYAIERAVASAIEQFIAAGRVQLVRGGLSGDAMVRSGLLLWPDG